MKDLIMCASRLNEIRNNLKSQIRAETDKTISAFKLEDKNIPNTSNKATAQPFRTTNSFESANLNVRSTTTRNHIVSPPKVAPRSECKALCIGMNRYVRLNPLSNATRDAQDMALVLNNLGFEVTSIFDRSAHDTQIYLQRFLASIRPGDDVVLTFAGHGGSYNSEPHLFPIDTKGRSDAINLYADFIDQLKFTNVKSAIVIIDACRNQERVEFENPELGNDSINQEDWELLEEWFEQLSTATNQTAQKHKKSGTYRDSSSFGHAIIFATSHDASASDGGEGIENGLFTYFFKQEVMKPELSLTEIFENVRRDVYSASNGRQKPSFTDDLSSRYYFYPDSLRP